MHLGDTVPHTRAVAPFVAVLTEPGVATLAPMPLPLLDAARPLALVPGAVRMQLHAWLGLGVGVGSGSGSGSG